MNYRQDGAEPAVMVEVYLPKRAAFQGPLYGTLTEAIRNPQVVKDHFTRRGRVAEIRAFLKEFEHLTNHTKEYVEGLPRLLYGFSMYEVDGVFLSSDERGVAEERTQVLRLFFKYPLGDVARKSGGAFWAKAFLRSAATSLDEFKRWTNGAEEAPAGSLEGIDAWVQQVWFFVHGFLLFKICDCVSEAGEQERKERRKDTPPLRQEEIWVVSAWAYQVNRAVESAE